MKNFGIEKIFVEMKQGDVDLFMAVWYDAHSIYLYEFGEVEDFGAVYEGCQLGWAVPAYSKFVNIGDLMSDPEAFNSTIFGIRKDAGVMLATKAVIQENKWSFEVKNLETQELSKQLQASKSQGKEFVTAAWTPDWKNAEYGLRFLVDTSGLFGKKDEIRKMGREGFAASFPEAHKIIEAIYMEDEQFSAFLNLVRDVRKPEKVEKIAKEWIVNNRSLVDEWLAAAKKQEAAL
uniref:Substrate-binding region of ABC-type glycine betaine transport system n=1 Tax=uncultured Flavobacteriia bacterium TaxID=212695 RepID=H6RFU5_9BACT|nr:glycine/betaine ABC transporter [uncultured bacterium]CCF99906.1 Substrate-binding region of ABC-type glycine betaine transport system [uncultured Flavobacteriia bacterium]